MPATLFNIVDTQGDTVRVRFPIVDDVGAPYDLTGCTVRGRVKEAVPTDDSPTVANFVSESTTGGVAVLLLSAATTAPLVGVFSYDVEVVDPAGEIDTVFRGTLTFAQQITTA